MKLHLTVNGGTLAGRVFELENGFLTIGRGENCSVRFDPTSERIASKQHAFIEARPDGYYLTDNQSTNGTILNGSRIETAKLNAGDTIQFGRNGVTGTVSIQHSVDQAPAPDQFRAAQINQFNQLAQQVPDANFQNSMSNIGLGNISTSAPEPNRTKMYIGVGVTIFAIMFMSMIVGLLMFASVGIIPAVVGAVVAFTPAFIYLFPLIWLDRYDPEPFWLLALAFAWGGLLAVIVSFIINTGVGVGVQVAVGGDEGAALGNIVGAVISAPLVEEGSKGIGVLVLLVFFRRYFDDILDGIVFAGVIALGFATVENVLYYGRGLNDAYLAHGLTSDALWDFLLLFALRGVLSPFAHVTFTSMTGIGCGISRESHNGFVKIIMPVVGYFGAVLLHALWNGMATFLGMFGLVGFLVGYIVIEIPFFLIFVGFALYVMRRQGKILKDMLAIDIARGLIPQEHGEKAVSAFKSTGWLLGGIFNGKFLPRSRYLRALGKLGLSYWHIQRATAAQGQTGSFQQNPILREEVLKWRDKV